MLTSEHNDKAKNDYVISEPKLGIGNINYGGIEMARGRPRGNKTQREIGRAVGKGLKGKSIENPFKAERKVVMLTSQTLPTQCHLTYKKSMALGYKLLAL